MPQRHNMLRWCLWGLIALAYFWVLRWSILTALHYHDARTRREALCQTLGQCATDRYETVCSPW